MRELRVVPPGPGVLEALRAALAGGPAILRQRRPGAAGPARRPSASASPSSSRPAAAPALRSGSRSRRMRVLANAAASESALGGPGPVGARPPDSLHRRAQRARPLHRRRDRAGGRRGRALHGGRPSSQATGRLSIPERYTSLVPAQLATLLDDAGAVEALRRFHGVLVGGQAAPAALLARAADHGIRIIRSYGASETSGGCVYDGRPIGTTHRARRRRRGVARRPESRRGLPRRRRADRRSLRHGRRRAVVPHRRRRRSGTARPWPSPGAATTSSSRAGSRCRSARSSGCCGRSRASRMPWSCERSTIAGARRRWCSRPRRRRNRPTTRRSRRSSRRWASRPARPASSGWTRCRCSRAARSIG